jgi:DNA-binding FadR family transcriptional regulator
MDASSPEPHPAFQALPLAGLRRLAAFDTVRVRIGMAVDLGLLRPGERLPANADIAAALEVGEITVRRALVSLCRDGVLVRRRGRDGGTLVAEQPAHGVVSEIAAYESAVDEVIRLIDHRLVLECGIVHLAALHVTEEDLGDLQRVAGDMAASDTWAQFHGLDERFHIRLAEAAGVASAAAELRLALHALYRYYLPYPIEYLRESNREHFDLIDALRRHDALAAVEIVHEHVNVLHRTMFVGLLAATEPGPLAATEPGLLAATEPGPPGG